MTSFEQEKRVIEFSYRNPRVI